MSAVTKAIGLAKKLKHRYQDELRARREELIPEHILLDDILSAINYGINLCDYYDDDDDEEEERSSLVVPVLTAVVVVVIVVAVIFVAMLLSNLLKGSGQKNDLTMPDFYGWDYQTAVSQYGNSIKFEVEGSEYNEADENSIIWQSIDPGTGRCPQGNDKQGHGNR